jgi:hypothetical protein
MNRSESYFHKLLRNRIGEEILSRTSYLAEGSAIDFPDYRYRVGYLQALRDVVEMCSDIERALNSETIEGPR